MKAQYLLPGEHDSDTSIVHTHGRLRNSSSKPQPNRNTNFISVPRIYEPQEKDFVIGIVIVRTPDLFLVDINSCETAVLPIPSFDHGRAPPRGVMNRLSVVYAHVVRADPWTQVELSCQTMDLSKKRSDFGLIENGCIIRCSLYLCEKLNRTPLIKRLQNIIKTFRVIISKNGFVWYLTDTNDSMIAVKNVIHKHEDENNIDNLVAFYHATMKSFQQQDDNVVKVKQERKQTVKTTATEKPQTIQSDNAVTRLLNGIIKDILNKIITDIENNENQ